MTRCLVVAALVAACTKEGAESSSLRDRVIAAWKTGGLDPSAFTPVTTNFGKDCASGTVNKLDVLLCSFGSDRDAKAAEGDALTWVGDTTGVARAQGPVLIVVADRHKADPSGKTINQVITLPSK